MPAKTRQTTKPSARGRKAPALDSTLGTLFFHGYGIDPQSWCDTWWEHVSTKPGRTVLRADLGVRVLGSSSEEPEYIVPATLILGTPRRVTSARNAKPAPIEAPATATRRAAAD